MIIDLLTKNTIRKYIQEEFVKLSDDLWKEMDNIRRDIIRIEEDIKILYNETRK